MAQKPPIVVDSCGDGGFIVNLQYIPHPDKGSVKNNLGTGFDIPLVNDTNAGLMSPEMLALLNLVGSGYEIDESFVQNDAEISISGDEIGGTITISTGSIGLTGTLFNVTTNTVFSSKSAVLISDISDNFAMGHTGLFNFEITAPSQITFSIKSAYTLEVDTTYRLHYFIKK